MIGLYTPYSLGCPEPGIFNFMFVSAVGLSPSSAYQLFSCLDIDLRNALAASASDAICFGAMSVPLVANLVYRILRGLMRVVVLAVGFLCQGSLSSAAIHCRALRRIISPALRIPGLMLTRPTQLPVRSSFSIISSSSKSLRSTATARLRVF